MAKHKRPTIPLAITPKSALFAFLIALLVTATAMFERLAEVSRIQLNLPVVPTTLDLVGLYLVYLIIGYRLYRNSLTASKHFPFTAVWILLYIVLVCAFIFVYPHADSGALGFYSDREEALDIGVNALLDRRFPYQCYAQSGVHSGCPATGNPLAPMPGAFLIAMPVIMLLGSAAWLSLISIGLAYLGLWWLWQSHHRSAQVMVYLVALSPVISAEILTGGDHLANAIFVSLPLLLLIQQPHRSSAPLLAMLLGIALAWRGLFWLVIVPVLFYFLRRQNWQEVFYLGMLSALGFGLVTLPFIFWDYDGFAPLAIQQRFQHFEHIIPHAKMAIPMGLIIFGSYLGWRANDMQQLILACGWMLLLPILIAVCLNSYEAGRPTTAFYGWYGITSLLFLGVATRGFPGEQHGQSPVSHDCRVYTPRPATVADDLGQSVGTHKKDSLHDGA